MCFFRIKALYQGPLSRPSIKTLYQVVRGQLLGILLLGQVKVHRYGPISPVSSESCLESATFKSLCNSLCNSLGTHLYWVVLNVRPVSKRRHSDLNALTASLPPPLPIFRCSPSAPFLRRNLNSLSLLPFLTNNPPPPRSFRPPIFLPRSDSHFIHANHARPMLSNFDRQRRQFNLRVKNTLQSHINISNNPRNIFSRLGIHREKRGPEWLSDRYVCEGAEFLSHTLLPFT